MLVAYLHQNKAIIKQYINTEGNDKNIPRKINMNNNSNRSPKYGGNITSQIQKQKMMNINNNGNIGPQNSNIQDNNFNKNYEDMKFLIGNNQIYNYKN